MFIEAFQAILDKACTSQAVRMIEASADCGALWQELGESGFLELFAPESSGGGGLPWAEAFPLVSLLGRYAAPAPVAQTIVSRLFTANVDLAPGAIVTIAASPLQRERGGAALLQVPYGMLATHVLCESDAGRPMLLPCSSASRSATGIHASIIAASLRWQQMPRVVELAPTGIPIALTSAAIHAALLAGAMERVLEICLRYAEDRSQFGKPIGKFQAVQQQMAVMAEQAAAARIAAQLPFAHGCRLGTVAVGKARCSEAAGVVAAAAHAVHGAIGVTAEYDLQLYTRRLHEWRIADGAETAWHERLGVELLAPGAPDFASFARTLELAI